ncbi:GNAT family N-acetyltransferase [Peribacillus alkalitolerans]|uniref:GNAT family N-acetyltransferase n=1 Tax=Peribacillus alkalitolerans TaxID=1550385 RepID=UPI0013D64DA3|nr:GNAT family N-acetyltransferase [Peribacillus alkalitolerans]
MDIRILTENDAEKYRVIRLQCLKDAPEAFGSSYEEEKDKSLDSFKSRLQSDYSLTFGAFDGSELVGVVTLVKETRLKLKHRANIYAMYVSPEFRGTGMGKKLISAALNKAKEWTDVEQINLTVVSTNESAKRLYQSFGFEVFGEEKRALKLDDRYLDEQHMVLFLK